MASVHAVTHTRFGKRAAIKIAHRSVLGDQYTPETFLREARIVHRIEHPAVIDVFATGRCEGRPYLVMERLTGGSLGDRVDAGPMPRGEALEILLELVDVLRAAHAAGVVHRDLKLDNVYVCDAPFAGGKRVKLLDWGVAYVAGEDDPFRGLIAGTLTYVAPEQIRGDSLTPAADIYSLAVVAYHLLCRRPPFAATTDLELIHLHLRAEPPRPNIAWPSIPTELDELLVSMLAKSPEHRPSLDEVERVLTRMLARLAPARRPIFDDVPATPPIDVLGRPAVLPVPPLSWGWIGLAGLVTGLAALISALP
jgi:serine/threonine protein kinase